MLRMSRSKKRMMRFTFWEIAQEGGSWSMTRASAAEESKGRRVSMTSTGGGMTNHTLLFASEALDGHECVCVRSRSDQMMKGARVKDVWVGGSPVSYI